VVCSAGATAQSIPPTRLHPFGIKRPRPEYILGICWPKSIVCKGGDIFWSGVYCGLLHRYCLVHTRLYERGALSAPSYEGSNEQGIMSSDTLSEGKLQAALFHLFYADRDCLATLVKRYQ